MVFIVMLCFSDFEYQIISVGTSDDSKSPNFNVTIYKVIIRFRASKGLNYLSKPIFFYWQSESFRIKIILFYRFSMINVDTEAQFQKKIMPKPIMGLIFMDL